MSQIKVKSNVLKKTYLASLVYIHIGIARNSSFKDTICNSELREGGQIIVFKFSNSKFSSIRQILDPGKRRTHNRFFHEAILLYSLIFQEFSTHSHSSTTKLRCKSAWHIIQNSLQVVIFCKMFFEVDVKICIKTQFSSVCRLYWTHYQFFIKSWQAHKISSFILCTLVKIKDFPPS